MRNTARKLNLTFLLFLAMVTVCCGKRGPSLPPLRIAPRPCSEMAVTQTGDKLLISFLLPERNADGSLLEKRPGIELLQNVSESDENGQITAISADEFMKRAKLSRSIMPLDLDPVIFNGRVFLEQDIFELYGDKAAGMQFSYAVQCVNEKKKKSALSGIVPIIAVRPLQAVNDLSASSGEEGINLTWTPSVPSSGPSGGRLFNLYRAEIAPEESSMETTDSRSLERMRHLSKRLNEKPVSENSFLDRSSRFGAFYLYTVREAHDASLPFRESADSNIVRIKPLDIFPPLPPSGLSAVTDKAMIRLFWFPGSKQDIAGYKVYRKSETEEMFGMIATLPPHLSSFSDKDAALNTRYSYYITAFDSAQPPNESVPSEIVVEMLEDIPDKEKEKEQ